MALHDRLRLARTKVGLTLEQIAQRVGVSVPSLSSYETGQREPSFALLAKLAKIYHRPVEFFLSEEPLPKESVVWRSKPPSPQAEELEAKLLELGRRYHALEEWNGCVRSSGLPKFARSVESAEVSRLAFQARGTLRLGDRPGTVLLPELEHLGVKIFHLAFEPKTASASTFGETFGPTVLLNALAYRRERTYALAHELFHLLTWGLFDEEEIDEAETFADCFANYLLLPDEPVRLAVGRALRGGKMTFRELDDIAKSFDVPLEPFLWRLGELFGRSQEETNRDVLRLRAGDSLGEDPPETAPKRPERFERLALKTYEDGKLALGRLADYLGISRQEAVRRYFHDGTESIADEEVSLAPPGR